jgi:hypothetical protein
MFEVKVTIHFGNVSQQVTLASMKFRDTAVHFAKQIDPEFAVQVINVEDEDNREKAFGLVFDRIPGSNEFGLIEPTI